MNRLSDKFEPVHWLLWLVTCCSHVDVFSCYGLAPWKLLIFFQPMSRMAVGLYL